MGIRAAAAEDRAALLTLALASGLFSEAELPAFVEVLDAHLSGDGTDQLWWVEHRAEHVTAAAYVGVEPFGDRVWNLYFLAVLPEFQGEGIGGAMVEWVVQDLHDRGARAARVLLVETSGIEEFAPVRAFYRRQGFVEEARVREFYGPGDDKVVFWRPLAEA